MRISMTSRGVLAGIAAGVALSTPALAAPANVTVRVEGDARTLVPETALTTTATPAGKGANLCPGTTALGALDRATAGDWAGTWYPSFSDWGIETIRSEAHAFSSGSYWVLRVNHVAASVGACGTELQEGDDVLFAPDTAGDPLELADLPARVAPNQAVTVRVTEHVADASGAPKAQPADGATVTLGGASATTGADGTAQLVVAQPGPAVAQATEAGHVRSATRATCVTSGADGACGTAVPTPAGGTPPVPAPVARDTTAPVASIAGLRSGRSYAHARAPRRLRGTVPADPSGLRTLRLAITRRVGTRCWAFDGRTERFKRHRCGGSRSFAIGDRADWSYLLPRRLPRGRYAIRVVAIDRAGNAAATRVRIRVR